MKPMSENDMAALKEYRQERRDAMAPRLAIDAELDIGKSVLEDLRKRMRRGRERVDEILKEVDGLEQARYDCLKDRDRLMSKIEALERAIAILESHATFAGTTG